MLKILYRRPLPFSAGISVIRFEQWSCSSVRWREIFTGRNVEASHVNVLVSLAGVQARCLFSSVGWSTYGCVDEVCKSQKGSHSLDEDATIRSVPHPPLLSMRISIKSNCRGLSKDLSVAIRWRKNFKHDVPPRRFRCSASSPRLRLE